MNWRKAFLSVPVMSTWVSRCQETCHKVSNDHSHQHVDKLEEAGRVLGVSELRLRVLDDLLPGEHGLLVPTQHGLHLEQIMSNIQEDHDDAVSPPLE